MSRTKAVLDVITSEERRWWTLCIGGALLTAPLALPNCKWNDGPAVGPSVEARRMRVCGEPRIRSTDHAQPGPDHGPR